MKRLIKLVCLFSLFVLITLSVNSVDIKTASASLTDGLVAHYTFDEGNGTTVQDDSGNAHTATLHGGTTFTDGILGKAISLNGSSDFASFEAFPLGGDHSISVWIYSTSAVTTNDICIVGTSQNLSLLGFNGVRGFYSAGNPGSPSLNHIRPSNGAWHHITLIANRTTNLAEILIDNVSKGSMDISMVDLVINSNNYPRYIGKTSSPSCYFSGYIDDLRFYDRTITSSEVSSLYNLPSDSTSPVVSITSPIDGANVSEEVTISANVSDDNLEKVQFYLDDELLGVEVRNAPYQINWDTKLTTNDSHELKAIATDLSGNKTTSAIETVIVSNNDSRALPAGYFVSPTGTVGGNGSYYKPWNLQTALNQPSVVKPGDTIWLLGGSYIGSFTSNLNGAASNPIIVRQMEGERVIVDGAGKSSPVLSVSGSYTWFWGFEVTDSDTTRNTSNAGSSQVRGSAIDIIQNKGDIPGIKFINMIIHDTDNGFGVWKEAKNTELYGNIVYYNGWLGPDRAHGHGIYIQNQDGTKVVENNIIFKQFSHGLHAYTESGFIDHITINQNVLFENGITSFGHDRNLLYGGKKQGGAIDCIITNNYTFYQGNGGSNNIGYTKGCTNVTITGNRFISMGGNALTLDNEMFNMTLFDNTFYGSTIQRNELNTADNPFSSLQYPNNIYLSTSLGTNEVSVLPNKYEQGRAHIVVYNWQNLSSVNVNVSNVLGLGDRYEVRDVQNYFGTPVAQGTYSGGEISLPMNLTSVSVPIGNIVTSSAHTSSQFGAFVLIRTSSSGNSPDPIQQPTPDPITSPTNASCSTRVNRCTTGTVSGRTSNTTHNLWTCNGLNGGTNASCSTLKTVEDPVNPIVPVDPLPPQAPSTPTYTPAYTPTHTPTTYTYKKPVTPLPKITQPTPDLPPSPSFEPLDFIPTDYIQILLDLIKKFFLELIERIRRGVGRIVG